MKIIDEGFEKNKAISNEKTLLTVEYDKLKEK